MKRIPVLALTLLYTSILFVVYTSCSPKKNNCTVCSNGGICQNDTCLCPLGYTGARCETDRCASVTCLNGGTCSVGVCTCPSGFEGTYCETVTRSKFLGNWSVFEHGTTSAATQYPISIQSGAAASDVLILNFYNYFTQPVKGYVVHDSLYIPNQHMEGKVVFGYGYIYTTTTYGQYGNISVKYEVIDSATNLPNDFGYLPDGSSPSQWNK